MIRISTVLLELWYPSENTSNQARTMPI